MEKKQILTGIERYRTILQSANVRGATCMRTNYSIQTVNLASICQDFTVRVCQTERIWQEGLRDSRRKAQTEVQYTKLVHGGAYSAQSIRRATDYSREE